MRVEQIGDATLYLGDCRDILPTLPKVDAVITDPPYGINENHKKNATRGGLAPPRDYGCYTWDTAPANPEQLRSCLSLAKYCCFWGGNYFDLPPSAKWLVWDKQNTGDFADCELAWTNHPGAVRIFRHMWNGMLRASERDEPRCHPTQKPIALMEWCIEQLGNPATILDPYMGSGTTGVAATKLSRAFIGIEIDQTNFNHSCRRIEQAYRQPRLDLAPPPPPPEQLHIFT